MISEQESRGDPDASAWREYIIGEVEAGKIRAQMHLNRIDTTLVALRGDLIDPDTALTWLTEADALAFVQPAPPGSTRSRG